MHQACCSVLNKSPVHHSPTPPPPLHEFPASPTPQVAERGRSAHGQARAAREPGHASGHTSAHATQPSRKRCFASSRCTTLARTKGECIYWVQLLVCSMSCSVHSVLRRSTAASRTFFFFLRPRLSVRPFCALTCLFDRRAWRTRRHTRRHAAWAATRR